VCVYYCSTFDKAVRVGGGGEWRTCATSDDEPAPHQKFMDMVRDLKPNCPTTWRRSFVHHMQATDEHVGVTETDAPPLVNSIRKSTQKKVSALALLGAWGPPPDEAAPRSSHDHEDGAAGVKQQAPGSRPGSRAESRISAGSRERKGWSVRPSSRDASYASWSLGGLQV
jgi:hypothetical protein